MNTMILVTFSIMIALFPVFSLSSPDDCRYSWVKCAWYDDGSCRHADVNHTCSIPSESNNNCKTFSEPGRTCLDDAEFKKCIQAPPYRYKTYRYCANYDLIRRSCMDRLAHEPIKGKC
jgi:hypothetical protein